MNEKQLRCSKILATLGLAGLLVGCATTRPVQNAIFFPPAPDEPRIQYLMSFGNETDLGGHGKFNEFLTGEQRIYRPMWKPYGVAIRNGQIYAADTQAGNITVADLGKRRIRYIRPEGQAAMKTPINVAVDADGRIYVTDTGRLQLLIYDQQGNLLEAVGKQGEMKPCGLVLHKDRIYLTDLKNHCVRVLSKATRQLLFTFPTDGEADGRLFQPTNLAIDDQNRVCVSDTGGFAVKIFSEEGKYLESFGDLGVTPGQFTLPKGIAVDRERRIYVVDAAAAVVQLFQPDGKLLMFFGDPGKSGSAGLYLPAGIAVDYDNLSYFQSYVAPGHKLEYVILVVNQAGPNKVSAYGFLKK